VISSNGVVNVSSSTDVSNSDTITLDNVTGVGNYGYALTSDANGNLVYEVCFLTGTIIEIPGGVCAVEDLKVGDTVLVYDPTTQKKVSVPVTWIGHKTTSVKSNLLNDEAGYPVRILKDAIAESVPNKDLLITAEHCLYFDGKFIPARMLINGYSIYYDTSMTCYDYYHIETAERSIVDDRGFCVGDVTLQRNGKKHLITTHLEADHLLGWDVKETIPCRWTKGKAFLPLT